MKRLKPRTEPFCDINVVEKQMNWLIILFNILFGALKYSRVRIIETLHLGPLSQYLMIGSRKHLRKYNHWISCNLIVAESLEVLKCLFSLLVS